MNGKIYYKSTANFRKNTICTDNVIRHCDIVFDVMPVLNLRRRSPDLSSDTSFFLVNIGRNSRELISIVLRRPEIASEKSNPKLSIHYLPFFQSFFFQPKRLHMWHSVYWSILLFMIANVRNFFLPQCFRGATRNARFNLKRICYFYSYYTMFIHCFSFVFYEYSYWSNF